MTLQQADIETLGRDAMRVLALNGSVSVEPYDDEVSRWLVHFEGQRWRGSSFVADDIPLAEIVCWMLESLTNDISETEQYWGVAFPRCPGHRHPAHYEPDGAAVALTCPVSGHEVSRTEVVL